MVRISSRGLLGLACLTLPVFTRAISPQASADKDLICSTTDPTDCYPRVFEPTEDFQIIKEGQDIPPGLHVRMDIYTGLREARLNIPMEGEEGAIEGTQEIPIEQAMVVIEQPDTEPEPKQPVMRDQVPINPPVYDTAGKIPPPPPSSGGEISTFQKAMLTVKMEARAFDSALDDLQELAHDIYYGLEIAKDGPVLEKLVCLIVGSGSERMPAREKGRDHKAASILASAIQNNPTALKEVSNFWRVVMYPTCGTELMHSKTRGKDNFVAILRSRLGREKDAGALKAKITAISGLLKEPVIRGDFLDKGGMEMLLAIFLKKGEQFDSVRQKVAQLITDNFLDESMGATLGIWPKMPVNEGKVCEGKERMLEDGCWESHVNAFSEKEPKEEWAKEFLAALKEQRTKWGDSVKDREL
jgi:nucleotide exchange factor SIL1